MCSGGHGLVNQAVERASIVLLQAPQTLQKMVGRQRADHRLQQVAGLGIDLGPRHGVTPGTPHMANMLAQDLATAQLKGQDGLAPPPHAAGSRWPPA